MSEQEIYEAKRDWECQQTIALRMAEKEALHNYRWYHGDWGRVADHFRWLQKHLEERFNVQYFKRLIDFFVHAAPNQEPILKKQYTECANILQQMIGG